jgi:hypothetical protein
MMNEHFHEVLASIKNTIFVFFIKVEIFCKYSSPYLLHIRFPYRTVHCQWAVQQGISILHVHRNFLKLLNSFVFGFDKHSARGPSLLSRTRLPLPPPAGPRHAMIAAVHRSTRASVHPPSTSKQQPIQIPCTVRTVVVKQRELYLAAAAAHGAKWRRRKPAAAGSGERTAPPPSVLTTTTS